MRKSAVVKSAVVREFAHSLNDDNLWYLKEYVFKSKPAGYMYDLLDLMGRNPEIDPWLKSSQSSGELFDKLDQIELAVFDEIKAREEYDAKKAKAKGQ